jgi:hypothetical protein
MLLARGRVQELCVLTTDLIAPTGFSLFRTPEPRRRAWSRGVSTILVGLVHLVFLAMLTFSVSMPAFHRPSVLETILMLPSLDGRTAPEIHMQQPKAVTAGPPEIVTAPITLPKPIIPPETSQKPQTGDVLRAVGEALSCGAGSFENLTQTERTRCRHEPWRAGRLPNGNLVMVPTSQLPRLAEPPPQSEFRLSGADEQRHGIEVAPSGCPVMLNVPCLNNIPHDNN